MNGKNDRVRVIFDDKILFNGVLVAKIYNNVKNPEYHDFIEYITRPDLTEEIIELKNNVDNMREELEDKEVLIAELSRGLNDIDAALNSLRPDSYKHEG